MFRGSIPTAGAFALIATALPAQTWHPVDAYAPTRWVGQSLFFDEWRRVVFSFVPMRGDVIESPSMWGLVGGEWVARDMHSSPPFGLGRSKIVFDRSRGRAVMCVSNSPRFEHWEWDGVTWARPGLPSTPPGIAAPILCWDDRLHRVLALVQGAFWALDGIEWRRIQTATTPPISGNCDLEQDRSSPNGTVHLRNGDEDWVFDDDQWRKIAMRSGPPGDRPFRLVHDRAGSRLLLLAGSLAPNVPIEVWRWSGGAWIPLPVANAPALSGGFAVADTPDGVLLDAMMNGATRTWLLRGDRWQPAAERRAEEFGDNAVIYRADVVEDLRRSCIWMLHVPTDQGTASLWQGRGGRWFPAPAVPPFSRGTAAFARDEARDRLVVISGGFTPGPGAIWESDGTSWQQVRDLPWPIRDPLACHDEASGRTVCVAPGAPGTFLWDGTNLAVTTAQAPAGPIAMAYDRRRQRIVLFASDDPARVYEWQGGSWLAISPQNPPVLSGYLPVLFFDPTIGEVVRIATHWFAAGDCHAWNGHRWIPASGYPKPPAIESYTAAWDATSRSVVLRGSVPWPGGGSYPQTFVLTVRPASLALTGTACGGVQPPRLLAFGLPRIGTPMQLDLTSARAGAPAAFLLGIGSAQIPFGPCMLYVDPVQPLYAVPARTNLHGVAELPLALPYDLALRGLALHAQAFVEDPNVAGTRIATSAALALRVGD